MPFRVDSRGYLIPPSPPPLPQFPLEGKQQQYLSESESEMETPQPDQALDMSQGKSLRKSKAPKRRLNVPQPEDEEEEEMGDTYECPAKPQAPTDIMIIIQKGDGGPDAIDFYAEIPMSNLGAIYARACSTRLKQQHEILATAYGLQKSAYQQEGDTFTIRMVRFYKVPKINGNDYYSYPPLNPDEFAPIKGLGPVQELSLTDSRKLLLRNYNGHDYTFVTAIYDDQNIVLMDYNLKCIYLRRDIVRFYPNIGDVAINAASTLGDVLV